MKTSIKNQILSPLTSAFICATFFVASAYGTAQGAVTYGFTAITNNNSTDVAIGESQLTVDVFDRSGFAVFQFNNAGPEDSSITNIYFDDDFDLLNAFATAGPTSPDPGVSFSINATPPDLPAGNSIIPPFNADYSLDSDPPAQPNGVNPGETLFVPFTYGGDINTIHRAINAEVLRVGIHVQGYESGGSESFISSINGNGKDNGICPKVIPEPVSLILGSLGLTMVGALKRRKVF